MKWTIPILSYVSPLKEPRYITTTDKIDLTWHSEGFQQNEILDSEPFPDKLKYLKLS